jgi:hypothetical protein
MDAVMAEWFQEMLAAAKSRAQAPSSLFQPWWGEWSFSVQVNYALFRFCHLQVHEEEKITLARIRLRKDMINQ